MSNIVTQDITIKLKTLESLGITEKEAFALFALTLQINEEDYQSLVDKGFITSGATNRSPTYGLLEKGIDAINLILIEGRNKQINDDVKNSEIIELQQKMAELFPKGKKPGTNNYWRGNSTNTQYKLKLFFKKYGNDFTNDEIIQATEKYVEGFNGSYQYMRLLKYFIFKEKVGANGEIEGDSELISYIENADNEDLRNEWTSTLN